MMRKGKIMYVPGFLVDEMNDIKKEKNIVQHKEAWKSLVGYSQVGREAERIIKLDFRHKPKRWFS